MCGRDSSADPTDERRARCYSHVSPRHSKLRHRKSLQSIDTDGARFWERSHQDRDAFPLRSIRLANTELCAGESQSGLHSEAFFAELAASGEAYIFLLKSSAVAGLAMANRLLGQTG